MISKRNTKPISKRSGIYILTNVVNGNIYVGQAADIANRWSCHNRDLLNGNHANHHLQNAFNKYGEGAFEFDVIEYCGKDKTELCNLEQKWMEFLRPEYNLSPSSRSNLGYKFPDEVKKRMSETRKGVPKAKPFSEEHKAALKAASGTPENRERLRKLHSGKPKSAEQRAKMSAWQIGRTRPEETKRKISESLKRRAASAPQLAI